MTLARVAVFSGPTATITNSPPLVTSNKARARHGLPLLTAGEDRVPVTDGLRMQRLAAPVTVYIEAFSAHPLEADAAHLYAPPDGWVDPDGVFTAEQPASGGVPVHVVELRPEDGPLPLPYMARQADGSAWEDATTHPGAGAADSRQTFYPDASRIYEEIDRIGLDFHGRPIGLAQLADFDFYRAAPSAGFTGGRAAAARTDVGSGDIPPEVPGRDFFPYYPGHLRREPTLANLAEITNLVQTALSSGDYVGAQWLEGSPVVEETTYWLSLLVDTTVPIVGHAAQRPHGCLSADGARNLVDGVRYILSGVALDATGADRVGPVVIVDEVAFAAREVTKTDARPGGFASVGGHGGIVADLGADEVPQITFIPARRHTHSSQVRVTSLPAKVSGVTGAIDRIGLVDVAVKGEDGRLLPAAMPQVTFSRYGRYAPADIDPADALDGADEVEILARIKANLAHSPLAGFVAEGMNPYGFGSLTADAILQVAVFCGMPVVRVGRGLPGGMVPKQYGPLCIAGNNLSATKARMLLMACLLKFGALPPATDPYRPTADEIRQTQAALRAYQEIFDTH